MLAIWHDVEVGHEAEVRDWYAREHHCERLGVPGFLEARRYDRLDGTGADLLCLYSVVSPDVLDSDAYCARLAAPTSWTQAVMPNFRNMSRSTCRIVAEAGRAEGGHLAALASSDSEVIEPNSLCQHLLSLPGVLRVRYIERVAAAAVGASAETALRGATDTHIGWAVLADADSAVAASAALQAARSRTGAILAAQCATYLLAYAARNPL
jgi:hypothetical protein